MNFIWHEIRFQLHRWNPHTQVSYDAMHPYAVSAAFVAAAFYCSGG
jgi:hypothetical protein